MRHNTLQEKEKSNQELRPEDGQTQIGSASTDFDIPYDIEDREPHNSTSCEYEENSQLICIVALGNRYSNIIDTENSEDPASEEPMLNSLLEEVGVSWVTLSGLHEAIIEELEKARIFLQITQKD